MCAVRCLRGLCGAQLRDFLENLLGEALPSSAADRNSSTQLCALLPLTSKPKLFASTFQHDKEKTHAFLVFKSHKGLVGWRSCDCGGKSMTVSSL